MKRTKADLVTIIRQIKSASEVRANHFGPAVRRFRRERGLKQKELAEELQVSTSHICDVESGRRGLADETLDRLLNLALQVR